MNNYSQEVVCIKTTCSTDKRSSDKNMVYSGNTVMYINPDAKFNYAPIFEAISINDDTTIKFTDSRDVSNDISTHYPSYDRIVRKRVYGQEVITKSMLDVSSNDLQLGPSRFILNLTNKPITTVTEDMYAYTYNPVMCDKLLDFLGKVVILTSIKINTIDSVRIKTGLSNYLDTLSEILLTNHNYTTVETVRILRFVKEKYSKITDNNEVIPNSITIVLATIINQENITSNDDTLYVNNLRLLLSYKDIDKAVKYSVTRAPVIDNKESILKNSVTVFIVDSKNKLTARYTSVLGRVIEVPNIVDVNIPDGLYVSELDNDGSYKTVLRSSLEDIDSIDCVYKNAEDALAGGNIQERRKNEIEQAKHDKELDRIQNTIVAETNKLRSIEAKSSYDYVKYQRDSTVETIKIIGSIVGVGVTAFMLYSKFNK